MDEAEAQALRASIVEDVADLLRADFEAEAWGRVLVEVVRRPDGPPMVAGVDVEEVLDEACVDRVFGGEAAHSAMPVLARAVEALCALDGAELDDVRGGTFVRRKDAGFAWLAGLVHAPSRRFDAERDALTAKLVAKNDALRARFGFPSHGRLTVDLGEGRLAFRGHEPSPGLRARATLVGSFVPTTRTWGWGGSNPHLPDEVRRASAALVDLAPDRDFWELSTPAFATDPPTAWALSALICDRAAGDGVLCRSEGDGLVFVLLREVHEEAGSSS